MELDNILSKRQSIRKYTGEPVKTEDIIKIIEAAHSAPSGKNIQNWHFVAIKNKEIIQNIADAIGVKNEEIAKQMEKKDTQKADTFRKFFRNFTLFFLNCDILTVIYSREYKPSGYNEMTFAEYDQAEINKLIHEKNPGMQSLGAAIENFTLKAIDLGYGTCWLTSANYADKEIEKCLEEEIGFKKDGYFFAAMIATGVPADGAKSPPKKPLEEVYTIVE